MATPAARNGNNNRFTIGLPLSSLPREARVIALRALCVQYRSGVTTLFGLAPHFAIEAQAVASTFLPVAPF
jgi:hypothetical protein